MANGYASEFAEIPAALRQNAALRSAVSALVAHEPMPGKVTEGGDRLVRFRTILAALVNGGLDLGTAIRRTELELDRGSSPHSADNKVFPDGWAERLVRTQFSRFYNQAVLDELIAAGTQHCFVPHSSAEQSTSACSQQLAGRLHDVQLLHSRLVQSYSQGKWTTEAKIPNHPHCTHVVAPEN